MKTPHNTDLPKHIEVDGEQLIPRPMSMLKAHGNFNGMVCRIRCYLGKKQQEVTGKEVTADNCKYTHLCLGCKNEYSRSLYFIKRERNNNPNNNE